MSWIPAQVHFVMPRVDVERLGQLSGTGTQSRHIIDPASRSHQINPAFWLERANQNQAVTRTAFNEHVEHPVHAVVKINVAGAAFVALDEAARTWAAEGVTGFVALHQIRFGFNDDAGASAPHQSGAN